MKKILVILITLILSTTMLMILSKPVLNDAEAANINVPDDYSSIQAAVDAAVDGDTVVVQPGTYQETVLIDKSLKLIAPDGAIIKCPAGPAPIKVAESGHLYHYLVAIVGGGIYSGTPTVVSGTATITVEMSGFTLDANNYVPTGRWCSILMRNVVKGNPTGEGSIHDNNIINIDVNGHETFGILGYGNMDIDVENNVINGFGRGGIGMYSGNSNIVGNTIIGPTFDIPKTWAANGIQLGYGAYGLVQGNDVSECGWLGTDWSGTGILIVDTHNVIVENNYVHDCETAIGVVDFPEALYGPVFSGITSEVIVRSNNVANNEWGMEISNDVTNIYVDNNDFIDTKYDVIDIYIYAAGINSPSNVDINNNNIITSGGHGIWVYGSSECQIHHNNIESNELHGIYMEYSDNNIIQHNYIFENKQGMRLDECDWNDIHHNRLVENRHNGIVIREGSDNNEIHHNIMDGNGWDGIRVRDTGTSNNNIQHNNLINNWGYGIDLLKGAERAKLNSFTHNVAHANDDGIDIFSLYPADNTWSKNVGVTSW